jgi:hypothetical protein
MKDEQLRKLLESPECVPLDGQSAEYKRGWNEAISTIINKLKEN